MNRRADFLIINLINPLQHKIGGLRFSCVSCMSQAKRKRKIDREREREGERIDDRNH